MSLPRPRDWDWEEENNSSGEASRRPQLAKRPRCSGSCDDKQMQLLKEMRNMLQRQNEKLESMYRENQDLREKVSCLTADIRRLDGYLQQSPVPRMSDQNCSIPLRLKFLNACKNDKYTTRKIEADDETPLKIAIYNHNDQIITCGPFSSMRVLIVPIHGDFNNDHKGQWTQEYFCSKIVTGRSGKEHLLSGDLYIRLQDGVGYLNNAKFLDNSSFVSCKRFKLGVMAADETISERVQEGITEPFAVKDVRGYSTKKNVNPSPRDAVYKLSRIAMNGDRHKLLKQNSIKTVEDFLCFYKRSPEDLRNILGKISDQEWDTIINHAHKCNSRLEIYSSCIQERNNVSHDNEKFSRSDDDTCYLQESCSEQPCPTPEIPKNLAEHLDAQLMTCQQISSTYNGRSSCASLEDVPGEPDEGIQVAGRQLPPMGNGIMSVSAIMDNNVLEAYSSQQGQRRYSSEYNITLDEKNNDELDHELAYLSAFLLDEQDTSWDNVLTEDSGWGGSCSGFDQIGGHSSASEAGSIGCRVVSSPAREAGSLSHTEITPTRTTRHTFLRGWEARRGRCRGRSPPPDIPWVHPLLRETDGISSATSNKDLTTDDEE